MARMQSVNGIYGAKVQASTMDSLASRFPLNGEDVQSSILQRIARRRESARAKRARFMARAGR